MFSKRTVFAIGVVLALTLAAATARHYEEYYEDAEDVDPHFSTYSYEDSDEADSGRLVETYQFGEGPFMDGGFKGKGGFGKGIGPVGKGIGPVGKGIGPVGKGGFGKGGFGKGKGLGGPFQTLQFMDGGFKGKGGFGKGIGPVGKGIGPVGKGVVGKGGFGKGGFGKGKGQLGGFGGPPLI